METEIAYVSRETLKGLSYLHSQVCVHENVYERVTYTHTYIKRERVASKGLGYLDS